MTDLLDQVADKPTESSTELVVVGSLVPAVIFAAGGADDVLAKLRAMVATVKTDISTPKGRADVKSLCYKIARSKTALDAMGKDLGDKLRAQLEPIYDERKKIREGCEALAEEVRAPLTKWESDEAERIHGHEDALVEISNLAPSPDTNPPLSSDEVRDRIAQLDALPDRDWREFIQRAVDTKASTRRFLDAELVIAVSRETREAEEARVAAEQEAARIAEEARLQAEREAKIAAEAAEAAKVEAERLAAEEAEKVRLANEAEAVRLADEAAAEKKRIEEKAAKDAADAKELADRLENERQAAIKRAEDAEAKRIADAKQAEIDRKAASDAAEAQRLAAERQAEADKKKAIEDERQRVADEKAKADDLNRQRENDTANKRKVNVAAKEALMRIDGVSEQLAVEIVTAIALKSIPHVAITY